MREFKFRAWDKTENMMARNVTELSYNSNGLYGVKLNHMGFEMRRRAKDVELMQYTGLKDKNGKEIYEGDILGVKDTDRAYLVEWNMEHGCYTSIIGGIENYIGDIGEEIRFNLLSNMRLDRCEIIGNIHENPELLEV